MGFGGLDWSGGGATSFLFLSGVAYSPALDLIIFAGQKAVGAGFHGIVYTKSGGGSPPVLIAGAIEFAPGAPQVVGTSNDGVNWASEDPRVTYTERPTGISIDIWDKVAWDANLGLFVICGNLAGVGKLATSPDGINWTERSLPISVIQFDDLMGGGASPGRFVAVGIKAAGAGVFILTSDNGTSWTDRTVTNGSNFKSILYDGGLALWAAARGSSDLNTTSPDAINWTDQLTGLAANNVDGGAFDTNVNLFMYVGADDTGYSWDGTTATALTNLPGGTAAFTLAYSPSLGMLVAAGNTVATSTDDGGTWTTQAGAPAQFFECITATA